jgi:hypothetical protein
VAGLKEQVIRMVEDLPEDATIETLKGCRKDQEYGAGGTGVPG